MNKKFFELSTIVKEAEEKKEPSIVGSAAKGAGYGALAAGGAHLAGSALGGKKLPNLRINPIDKINKNSSFGQKVGTVVRNAGTRLKQVPYGKTMAAGAVIAGGVAAAKKMKKKTEENG